ncbi:MULTISPECIES: 16S rRNA (cytidine(1402)-2'-O)-methyltransferase [unclassified Enterococcus]|uniref:16S rRNA (cytidine(1402)-2'-O)-methyltransferase n=1 Tax=unclassified Enterococcus TaxID=2608891 RepID=UPI00190659D5|nr:MULTISPECIES: 16S rRNA (cytidine(1402)-2'-O)-methyltransferase [unclassified Enterococcus]MBW9322178.1 16S rRNA (cytidine(1402)-2'-O)-methyltransferase [Enterococcus casseliflavus]MBK0036647.1 16S rRNA (cytidine(1402)-2'-O)-methyltransferase [Enterococcus sp. S52]MBK0069310.1 16S rRNA (cytidine(1402)-2'-O)-methyltransferase [Enterococcus sp. S53]MBK0139903.1 16S rRNA (cytidine(1402)-2'-O)-methyltransferase [Enterococcus sp. S76]MBK0143638.1 16S rRNA (cytidine(1402)-2'-O)-methyltransferase [
MLKQQSYKQDTGKLYLVPTPIGNLEDMTVRCVKILKEADLIASEDTRNTQKLLNHFEITTPQKSLHEHNYKERVPQLVEQLQMGKTIAQCSDAGMPSISDPGHELVKACLVEGIAVIALPGPTAGLTALIASGLSPQPNLFYGFLPRKKKEQKQALSELATQKATMIFYESPYRIAATIETMQEVFGERQAVICRELTKIHEEYLRGTFSELTDYLEQQSIKGECCLLVEGSSEIQEIVYEGSYAEQVAALMQEAELSSKEAIKEVAKRNQVKKQLVYQAYHQIEE